MEQEKDALTKELEAMAVIGHVLGDLTDPAVRSRVLRWATERFSTDVAVQQAISAVTAPAPHADLSVDSLSEIFGPTLVPPAARGDDSLDVADEIPEKKLPLDQVVRSFADEFRAFAEEWNGAAA